MLGTVVGLLGVCKKQAAITAKLRDCSACLPQHVDGIGRQIPAADLSSAVKASAMDMLPAGPCAGLVKKGGEGGTFLFGFKNQIAEQGNKERGAVLSSAPY